MASTEFIKDYNKITSDDKHATYFHASTMFEFAEDYHQSELKRYKESEDLNQKTNAKEYRELCDGVKKYEDDLKKERIKVTELIAQLKKKEKRPSPYKWIKEDKFQIPAGSSYHEPKVNLIQCANWITEYVKKYC